MTKHSTLAIMIVLVGLCSVPRAFGFDEAATKAAIEKWIASYTAAFNAGDAKALAAHWLPKARTVRRNAGCS